MSSSLEPLETTPPALRAWTEAQKRLMARHAKERRYVLTAMALDEGEDLKKRVNRMEECCAYPIVAIKGEGAACVVLGLCRDRMCPRCATGRGAKAAAKIETLVRSFDSPRFVTLTLAHRRGESLVAMLDRLQKAFRELRKNERWKRKVKGGVWSIEVTRNQKSDSWHAHLHLIVEGEYYKQSELSLDWECVTKDSRIVDIRSVHSRCAVSKYIATYIAKPHNVDSWEGGEVCEYARAMHGRRLLHTFGTAHGIKVDEDLATEKRVLLEPVCSTARIASLAHGGMRQAIEARHLLLRSGSILNGLLCDTGFGNRPTLPPLDADEGSRLVKLLREIAQCPREYNHEAVSASHRREKIKAARRAQRGLVWVPESCVLGHDERG